MSFKEFLDHLKAEGRVIRTAPVSFCSFVAIAGFVIFLLVDWHYAGTISGLQTTIGSKDAQYDGMKDDRDKYKDLAEHPESNPNYADAIKQRDGIISNLTQSVDELSNQLASQIANVGLPRITMDYPSAPDISNQRPNLMIHFNISVTNEEPMNKLVITATVVDGDAKIIDMGSDGLPMDFHAENVSNGKSWIYTAFPVHKGYRDLYVIFSDPCSIKFSSPSLSNQPLLKITRTNIVESFVK